MNHRLLISSILCVFCLALAAAADPAPAVVYKLNDKGVRLETGGFQNAFVTNESVDGLQFVLDDPASQTSVSLRYGTYEVVYRESENYDYNSALGKRQADKAAEAFMRAAQSARLQWEREESLVRAAQAFLEAKKPDDALTTIATLEKDGPRSIRLPQALRLRGEALAAKGDIEGANKTYVALIAMAKDWGDRAAFLGMRGQAALLRTANKHAEAAAAFAGIATKMGANSPEYAPTVLEQADCLLAAGKGTEAETAYRGLCFKEIPGPLQAKARLGWAASLATRNDAGSLIKAFDVAVMALYTAGAEPAVAAQAKTVAQGVFAKLDKDASVSAADKAELKRALQSL